MSRTTLNQSKTSEFVVVAREIDAAESFGDEEKVAAHWKFADEIETERYASSVLAM